VMRPSEIGKFSKTLKNLMRGYEPGNINCVVNVFNEFGEGMELCDIPFPNLKSVAYYGFDLWSGHRKPDRIEGEYLIFEETPDNAPNWMELLILIDKVVGRAGDLHHNYFSGFAIEDNRLRVHMDS